LQRFAAAADMRGRGSQTLSEKSSPDEVVMAPAQPDPQLVELVLSQLS